MKIEARFMNPPLLLDQEKGMVLFFWCPIFHPRTINEAEINLLKNAVGSRGSYPPRNITNSQSSVSFFLEREEREHNQDYHHQKVQT
jgi:hypothetical protein